MNTIYLCTLPDCPATCEHQAPSGEEKLCKHLIINGKEHNPYHAMDCPFRENATVQRDSK